MVSASSPFLFVESVVSYMEDSDFADEFGHLLATAPVNPFNQSEVCRAATMLGYDRLASFVEEVSEDVYLLHAQEWYDQSVGDLYGNGAVLIHE